MPLMDEFREEREAIKHADFKTKAKYFWDYYKIHTIVAVSLVIFIVVLIHDIVTTKKDAIFIVPLNCLVESEEDVSAFGQSYAEYAGIDTGKYEVEIDYNINFEQNALEELQMSAPQRLMAYTATGALDVIIGGADIFPEQANQGMFGDLRDILSVEQLAKYEPYFYYVDMAVIDASYEITDPDATYPDMPDPDKPEDMEQPIPVGLFVTDCDILTDTFDFNGDYCAIGIMVDAPNVENSLKLLEYIFE